MNILEAAAKLRPGTAWNLRGDKLEQAEDGTPRVAPPTMEEIQAAIVNDPFAYRALRVPEYPLLADQLDAIWKGGDALDAMRASVLAVKEKYPKPE